MTILPTPSATSAVAVASKIRDRRPTYRAVCTCGFKSRAHVSVDSAVFVLGGHRVQCRGER